jgi:dihydrofolate reductase
MRVVVINHITLDGVMQSPGRPDEDTRGGFEHGGWAIPGGDEVMGRALGERMGRTEGALLLGRRSYEDMLSYWNGQGEDDRFAVALNNAPKYVASHSADTELEWPNSTLLHGDVPGAVAEFRQRAGGGDLTIMGSGELIHSLLPRGLIDEFLLFIHPLVVGSGLRLFPDDGPAFGLRLTDSMPTSTGVIIATYSPA